MSEGKSEIVALLLSHLPKASPLMGFVESNETPPQNNAGVLRSFKTNEMLLRTVCRSTTILRILAYAKSKFTRPMTRLLGLLAK